MCCENHCHKASCVPRVPIFHGLNDLEVQQVHKLITSKVYQKRESSDTLYLVNEGLVKIFTGSDEGKEQIIRILFPGDFFGQNALLETRQHYAHAEVLEKTIVCEIKREDFTSLLEKNPKMAMRFMAALMERLQLADEWMGTISLLEVERRLARALLMFYERGNQGPYLQLF